MTGQEVLGIRPGKGVSGMKVGIIGAGNIAKKMATTINGMEEASLYAVSSRELKKAEQFAREFHVGKAYGSYEDMLNDPEVELVYIATPHSHHSEHAKLCLNHGKHVLCEKAFTANAAQAREVLSLAKEKKLLIAEAIWSRYLPMAERLVKLLNDGAIGEVKSLQASFGVPVYKKERMSSPELAGGALLDLGIYPLNFALIAFGHDISNIVTAAELTKAGVDAQHSIILKYRDGKIATLNSSMMNPMEAKGIVYGTKGYLVVYGMTNYEKIELYNEQYEKVDTISCGPQITGYEYEVRAAIKAIQEGKTECEQMPHEETMRVMELMDGLRKEWGVHYPWDEER